jgi:hypothetical protein
MGLDGGRRPGAVCQGLSAAIDIALAEELDQQSSRPFGNERLAQGPIAKQQISQ